MSARMRAAAPALGAISVLGLLFLWWAATGPLAVVDTSRFPDPRAFAESFRQIAFSQYAGGDLAKHVLTSVSLVLRGFAIAVMLGLSLGLVMSLSAFWRDVLLPVFNFVRPVPPLAWIPLALLWFGLGDASKLFVMVLAAAVPLVINTLAGVAQIDRHLLEAARVQGARGRIWLVHVILPGAMPHIMIGMRLALQTSWTVIVAAELLGAIWGVGKVLNAAKDDVYPGMVLVGMVVVAALGMLSSGLLRLLERRWFRWRA